MGVMPTHKATGNTNYNSITLNEHKYEPLRRHLEYLLNLGEVQVTRVVATLIDGTEGCAKRNNHDDVTFLPMSMGFCLSYQQYMASLGCNVWSTGAGYIIVEGIGGKEVDLDDFVSFSMYY